MKITWIDWLSMAGFLMLSNYIPMLAAVVIMAIVNFVGCLLFGAVATVFAAAKPAPVNSSNTHHLTL